MSQVLINQYLGELDRLKKIGGTHRESVVREAFKDLLKGWGRQHDLQFTPEYRLDSPTKVQAWIEIHQDELAAAWQMAVNGFRPGRIAPLQ